MKRKASIYHDIDLVKRTTTESLAKWLLWVVTSLIIIFGLVFLILVGFGVLILGEGINLLLSSVIAMFAFVEGYSTYLQTRMENDRNRLQEIKEELEKFYGPLYSIFSRKKEYIQELEYVFINESEKSKVDSIVIAYPFLAEPIMLDVWRTYIERLEPYKKDPVTIYAIPMFFVSHVTIPYDWLTDEYHKRVGKDRRLTEPSFWQRTHRYPPRENGNKS